MRVDAALAKKDPNDTRALLRLAEQHVKAGEPEIACEVYAHAGDVFVRQGFARRAISAFAQALECARAQVATHPRVAPIARAMAKLYAKEKLVREAVATLDAAAKFLIERGVDDGVAMLLEERIALDDSSLARVRHAEALFRVGEFERGAAELHAMLARLQDTGARDEAIEVAERFLQLRRDGGVARACAEMYLARNRPGDAFLALAKLRVSCEQQPEHVPTLELLARAFVLARHEDKAERVRREIALLQRKTETTAVPEPPPSRIDVGRASFWQVPGADLTDDSVVSVSLTDVELVDGVPDSHERASLLETALERIESLCAEARFEEASLLIARHLAYRPNNALLLEAKQEIEALSSRCA